MEITKNCGSIVYQLTPEELEAEVWKPYANGPYLISNYGRVKSKSWNMPEHICRNQEQWNGMVIYHLLVDGKLRYRKAQRLVADTFGLEKPGPGYELTHINGNRNDNRLCNLKWVTHSENMSNIMATVVR